MSIKNIRQQDTTALANIYVNLEYGKGKIMAGHLLKTVFSQIVDDDMRDAKAAHAERVRQVKEYGKPFVDGIFTADEIEAIKKGKLNGVKEVKQTRGLTLMEAKRYVEKHGIPYLPVGTSIPQDKKEKTFGCLWIGPDRKLTHKSPHDDAYAEYWGVHHKVHRY